MTATPSTNWTTGDLASRLAAELRGPGDLRLSRLDTIEQADASSLTFIRDAKNAAKWASSRAGAAVVSRHVANDPTAAPPPIPGRALVVVDDADLALIAVLEWLAPPSPAEAPGASPLSAVSPEARVAPSAHIGPHCTIGPGAVIGERCTLRSAVTIGPGAVIGDDCDLHPGVVVYARSRIGARCRLHAGAVVGADGFGYRPSPDKRGLVKVPHIGIVEIHDDVEIGANTTIDRAKFGATVIGAGTKIDNLVQIGHNVRVGRSCIICGCAALAGSVTLGDGVTLAGGVGLADGITVGSGATIGARSGVMDDIPPGEMWVGYPARPARQTMRIIAAMQQLPDVMSQVRKLLRSQ